MKTTLVSVVAAVLLVALLGVVWRGLPIGIVSIPQTEEGVELTNLPSTYCPGQADVVVLSKSQKNISTAQRVGVVSCNRIPLASLTSSLTGRTEILIKLPSAMAFQASVTAPSSSQVNYPLQLGDVNNDNVIDNSDEELVIDALFSESSRSNRNAADIDRDGRVTVLDLSLVRLNQGVGVSKPDKSLWQQVNYE